MNVAEENIQVSKIWQENDRTLGVQWTDGQTSHLDVVRLRQQCPCASCIDEWTHEKKLRPEDVSDTVRPIKIDSVGRYALTIRFNDGHGTGIYTFKMLRDMYR